jgi:hypothetical protein
MPVDVTDELERRLDRMERRQRYALLLLVYPYLVGLAWAATGGVEVDATTLVVSVAPGLAIALGADLVALSRARARDGE